MAKQEQITKYRNCGLRSIYDRMMEVRRRRGYDDESTIWEMVIDLDKKLTEAEKTIESMRKLP